MIRFTLCGIPFYQIKKESQCVSGMVVFYSFRKMFCCNPDYKNMITSYLMDCQGK